MMARVRGVMASSIPARSRFSVWGSISTKKVGNSDEGERRDDDFIAFGNAESADAEMEGAGPGIYGDGVRRPDVARDGVFEFLKLGTEAKAGSAEDAADGGDVCFSDVGSRERDSHCRFFDELVSSGSDTMAWCFISSSWVRGTVLRTWTIFSEAAPSP